MRIKEFQLKDTEWGDLSFLQPIPRDGDPWGDFSCLRDTYWGQFIPIISAQLLEQAILGHAMPLIRELSLSPFDVIQKFREKEGICQQKTNRSCVVANQFCKPCEKVPECYEPPFLEGDAFHAARLVTLAWRDQTYVIVVEDTT